MKKIIILSTALLVIPQAHAYIGPGLGVGAIASFLGLIVGFLMLIVGVIWYPFKRLVRRIWPKT